MANISCILFSAKNLTKDDVSGKRVLEIGSQNINGSIREFVESLSPFEYVGVDIEKGLGVDVICYAENLVEKFGEESFDVVISMEAFEHIKDWKKALSNAKRVCKPGGVIIITTRSYGFPYHSYPYDFWRYESEDMKNIFSDCDILSVEKDKEAPGVFVKVKKPSKFTEADLSNYELYNIVENRKISKLSDINFKNKYHKKIILKQKFLKIKLKIEGILAKLIKRLLKLP